MGITRYRVVEAFLKGRRRPFEKKKTGLREVSWYSRDEGNISIGFYWPCKGELAPGGGGVAAPKILPGILRDYYRSERNLVLCLPRLAVLVSIEADRSGAWFPGLLGPCAARFPGTGLSQDFERVKVPGTPTESPFCFCFFSGVKFINKNYLRA